MSEKSAAHAIFLDESGVNLNMIRRYGRAKGQARVADSSPVNTPIITTIVGSISFDGSLTFSTYQGGTTIEKFKNYLEQELIPSLRPGDTIYLDNLGTHHSKKITNFLDEKGVHYEFLPPYSPDFNPIEMLWSKIKDILRSMGIRTKESLKAGIEAAFKLITRNDCRGWFKHCGYQR